MGAINENDYRNLEQSLLSRAERGDIDAYKSLGDLYYQGLSGKDKNAQKAYPYWKKAADAGDRSAASVLGMKLIGGTYGKNRAEEAIPYLKVAAESDANGPGPQFMLGWCYEHGIGINGSRRMAKSYYRMAALNNDANAQYRLGVLQFQDNEDENLHWLCCAAVNGNKDALDLLNHFMNNAGDNQRERDNYKEYVLSMIDDIKKYGIEPPVRSNNYASGSSYNQSNYNNNSRSSGGGCYIATAVYGSYDAPEVLVLRRFRDEYLLAHWWGKIFVKVYYTLSPPLAEKLKKAKWLNRFVRGRLNHFVSYLRNRQYI